MLRDFSHMLARVTPRGGRLPRSMNFLPVKAAPALVPLNAGWQLSRTPRRDHTSLTAKFSSHETKLSPP